MAATPPICDFGWSAVDFTLKGTDGKFHRLDELKGENGTLIVFMCNHCPYVLAVLEALIRDAKDLETYGIKTIGINANDPVAYPADSFANMVKLAAERALPFPYLIDESQEIARAYDAACTPDFFGFNRDLELQYRGRINASRLGQGAADTRRDLFEAMKEISESGHGPKEQIPSMGCSIKWRN